MTNQAQCARILSGSRETLAKLPVKSAGVPLPVAAAQRPATLAELLSIGAASDENATAVMVWFRNELTLVTDTPVLLAIDNYNCLHNRTCCSRSAVWRPV